MMENPERGPETTMSSPAVRMMKPTSVYALISKPNKVPIAILISYE
jgi:hypothetical protein